MGLTHVLRFPGRASLIPNTRFDSVQRPFELVVAINQISIGNAVSETGKTRNTPGGSNLHEYDSHSDCSLPLQAILDATDVMMAYLDTKFHFVMVNSAYAETCKKSPAELIGQNHFSLYPHAENESIFQRVRDTGEPVCFKDKPFEFPDQPERGVTYWDWSLIPLKSPSGGVTGLVFSLRETTGFKLAVQELAKSETRFRAMIEQAGDGFEVTDETGQYCDVNTASCLQLGYSREELLQLRLPEIDPRFDRGKYEHVFQSLIGKPPITFESAHRRKDGTEFPVEITTSVARIDDSLRAIALVRDITARRDLSIEPGQTREIVRNLVESSMDLVFVKDLRLRCVFCNLAFAKSLGKSVTDVIGKNDIEVGWDPALVKGDPTRGIRGFEADDRDALKGQTIRNLCDPANINGEIRIFDTIKVPFRAMDGSIIGVMGISRDVTERHRITETLDHERQFTRTLLDALAEGVVACDANGTLSLFNKTSHEWHGIDAMALPPDQWAEHYDLFGPDGQTPLPTDQVPLLRAFRGEYVRDAEMTILARGQAPRHILANCSPIMNAKNEKIGAVASMHDITERRNAADQLKASEIQFRSLFENMLNGYCLCRMIYDEDRPVDFVYLSVNAAHERLTGLKNVVGKRMTELVPRSFELDYKSFEIFGRVARTGVPESFETFLAGVNDWYSIAVYSPMKDHFVAVFDVITERKLAEENLREAHDWLAMTNKAAKAGSWDWDVKTGKLRWSAEFMALFGLDAASEHTFDAWRATLHPADRESAEAKIKQALKNHVPMENEYRVLLPDGQVRWIVARGTTVSGDDGAPVRMMGICVDATDRKRDEEARHQIEAQALQAQKLESLGVLAGGMAHDFNNLLTGILGNAELAYFRLAPNDPVRAYVERITKASLQAADLTQQMLAYSGKGRFVIETLDLPVVVESMSDLLKMSVSKKAALSFELGTPHAVVKADATQIRQILINLVTNASDALGDTGGSIVVVTSVRRFGRVQLDAMAVGTDLAEGDYVVIEVSDNGCGMDDETRKKMFEPFFTTKMTGRGLGLAAVQGIVRGHRGAMDVESQLGKGTRISILLPLVTDSVPADKSATTSKSSASLSERTILVIDDEPHVRDIARDMLGTFGVSVIEACDGIEGMEFLKKSRDSIACVLLDLTMPRMDGRETMHEIMRLHPGMKVVLMSGYSVSEIEDRFVGAGFAAFLQKPFTLDALRRTIEHLFETP